MADEKIMGKEDLKNFLIEHFHESNQLDNLMQELEKAKAQLEKEVEEEVPSFYGAASRYISTQNSISDFVDSKGNINVAQIASIKKIAKTEYDVQKNRELQAENNIKQVEQQKDTMTQEEAKKYFEKIDYTKPLSAEDYKVIGQNFDTWLTNTKKEDIAVVAKNMEEATKIKGLGELINEMKEIRENGNKPLSDYLIEQLSSTEEGKIFLKEANFDEKTKTFKDVKKVEELAGNLIELDGFVKNIIKEKGQLTNEDIQNIKNDFAALAPLLEKGELVKNMEEQAKKDLEQDKQNNKSEQSQEEQAKKELEQDKQTKESEQLQEEQIENVFDNMFAETEDPALGLENIEQNQSIVSEKIVEEFTQTEQSNSTEFIEENVQEEQTITKEIREDTVKEDLYESETFEDKGSFFSKILNSIKNILPKNIQERFSSRGDQKRLNSGDVQRTEENGVTITEFTENGTLEPWNVKLRNAAIDLGSKMMDAVNKIVTLSNTNKESNAVINQAYIVGSEKQQTINKEQVLSSEVKNVDYQQSKAEDNLQQKPMSFNDVLNPNSSIYDNSRNIVIPKEQQTNQNQNVQNNEQKKKEDVGMEI